MKKLIVGGLIGAAALIGLGGVEVGHITSHSAHLLPHQNDPNYVPVMVWQPGLGTDLQYKPANGLWTCIANSEAEDIGYEDCGA